MAYFQFHPETENANTQNLSILSILSDNLLRLGDVRAERAQRFISG
jgi:hypothetical protein